MRAQIRTEILRFLWFRHIIILQRAHISNTSFTLYNLYGRAYGLHVNSISSVCREEIIIIPLYGRV